MFLRIGNAWINPDKIALVWSYREQSFTSEGSAMIDKIAISFVGPDPTADPDLILRGEDRLALLAWLGDRTITLHAPTEARHE